MCTYGIGGADCKKCARFQKIANVGHASVNHCWQTVLVWHMLANSSFFLMASLGFSCVTVMSSV